MGSSRLRKCDGHACLGPVVYPFWRHWTSDAAATFGRIVIFFNRRQDQAYRTCFLYTMSKFALSTQSQGLRSSIARDGIFSNGCLSGLPADGIFITRPSRAGLAANSPVQFPVHAGSVHRCASAARQSLPPARTGRAELTITPHGLCGPRCQWQVGAFRCKSGIASRKLLLPDGGREPPPANGRDGRAPPADGSAQT